MDPIASCTSEEVLFFFFAVRCQFLATWCRFMGFNNKLSTKSFWCLMQRVQSQACVSNHKGVFFGHLMEKYLALGLNNLIVHSHTQ
jgi:hypothetical protein